jgi:sulfatase-modifying factor enzyme 1
MARRLGLLLASAFVAACGREAPREEPDAATVEPPPIEEPPDAGEDAEGPVVMPEPRCPPDMVKVRPPDGPGYCVDRYEAILVDKDSNERIPPYYAPSRKFATMAARTWESMRFEMGPPDKQAIPLPQLPAWMLAKDFEPRAVSRQGVTPNGHVSGEQAVLACRNAAKRLCTASEWRIACGGEQGWQFPYGTEYVQGSCNVYREGHPAALLHDNAAVGHTDPRLNRVKIRGKPLLRETGATTACASKWGDDVIYDMVGNIDEWIDDPEGTFMGGFYSRTTKDGCDKVVKGHPIDYGDYSTGVRCCADLPSP